MTIEAEVGMMSFEGGRANKSRKVGGFWKLEKAIKDIFPIASIRNAVVFTPLFFTLRLILDSDPPNC